MATRVESVYCPRQRAGKMNKSVSNTKHVLCKRCKIFIVVLCFQFLANAIGPGCANAEKPTKYMPSQQVGQCKRRRNQTGEMLRAVQRNWQMSGRGLGKSSSLLLKVVLRQIVYGKVEKHHTEMLMASFSGARYTAFANPVCLRHSNL